MFYINIIRLVRFITIVSIELIIFMIHSSTTSEELKWYTNA